MIPEAYIYDAIRTPRGLGKTSGALYEVKPITLVSNLLSELECRNQIPTHHVDDIILGCVTPIGEQGANIAKTASITAGWNNNVAGVSLNRFCASGLEAVNLAAMKIRSGWERMVVAGGIESMSRVKMGSDGGAWAFDAETNLKSNFIPQGVSADLIATLGGFDREELDYFAARSHELAAKAWERGAFDHSIIPVKDRNGLIILEKDELIRPDCTLAGLGKLKPAFKQMGERCFDAIAIHQYPQVETLQHNHTAGNASGVVDGSALVLIGNGEMGTMLGRKPRARIISTALVGEDPTIMLTGPAPAALKALAIAGLTVKDIDLFEVNEAFSAVVLHFINELNIPLEKVNVNGGSIAMGHPLGATGAMLVGTLLDELEAQDKKRGLVTLCVGGGMGIATIIERV